MTGPIIWHGSHSLKYWLEDFRDMGRNNIKTVLLYIFKLFGGFSLTRKVTRGHPRIIMYHRVLPLPDHDATTLDNFIEQLDLIKKYYEVITLNELITAQENGKSLKRTVVLTFDDGYYDFYEYAFPELKARGLKATIFVTTGFVDNQLWLWPDQLRYCLKETKFKEFYVDELTSIFSPHKNFSKCWNEIADYCLTLDECEKKKFIESVFEKAGVIKPEHPPNEFRPVTWTQLDLMAKEGIEVGSHSHSHPILTKVDYKQLKDELNESKALIKKHLSLDDIGFCYPNGLSTDFDDKVKEEVELAGYRYGVSALILKDPLIDRWEIGRYPANKQKTIFKNHLYGVTYLNLKFRSKYQFWQRS